MQPAAPGSQANMSNLQLDSTSHSAANHNCEFPEQHHRKCWQLVTS